MSNQNKTPMQSGMLMCLHSIVITPDINKYFYKYPEQWSGLTGVNMDYNSITCVACIVGQILSQFVLCLVKIRIGEEENTWTQVMEHAA